MIPRQRVACSYAPSGVGEPSGGIGAVPATCTRSPATTARENPATPSYGEWPVISLRSIGAPSIAAVDALHQIDAWDVPFAAAGVTRPDGVVATRGDTGRVVRLASVSKPVTALAVLVAAEEGVVDLDEPAGPPGATVRHLLAHASGLPFEGDAPIAPPGRRRIYSNEGFRVLGAHLAERAEMPFDDYVTGGGRGSARRVARSERSSRGGDARVARRTSSRSVASCSSPGSSRRRRTTEMVSVQFPGLDGVLPDFGRFSPLDWGLGVELKGAKEGHWSGTLTSPRTFGHFGGSGTFLWVDPDRGVACAALTTRDFGDWAKEAWPRLSDAVLRELD